MSRGMEPRRATRRSHRRWMPLIAAALAIVIAAGGALVAARSDAVDAAVQTRPAAASNAPTPPPEGYRLFASDGGIFTFGDAGFFGGTGGLSLNSPVVGMAGTPTGDGYWLVAMDGGVFAFGDAQYFGGLGDQTLAEPIAAIATTPSGRGYWLVALDGGVFTFGDAGYFGGLGGQRINAPIVGMTATPSGQGYWLVGIDGGVYAFGDAEFLGSVGDVPLNAQVVGIARTESGRGYWLVGLDGGVFAFGDAPYTGGLGGVQVNAPIVGLARTSNTNGYALVGLDGGVFTFGDAPFLGSTGGMQLNQPVLGMANETGGSSGSLFPYFLRTQAKKHVRVGEWPGPNQVALTFDDGPNPTFTPQVLDILAREQVPATFFVVGGAAARAPELLQRAVTEGHSVQNHTYGHETLTSMSAPAIVDNLQRTSAAIIDAIGIAPTCYRPPSGLSNSRVVETGASIGLTEVKWTHGTGDWTTGVSTGSMISQGLAPADGRPLVILMHDGGGAASARESTVAALPSIIEGLRARGYQFVSLCG